MRIRSRAPFLPAAVLGIVLTGCSDRIATAPVEGVVYYDGDPLHVGTVTFLPEEEGPYATGTIRPDGTFTMTTYDEGDGAILGKHRVMISAISEGTGLPEDPIGEPILLIPERYGSDKSSGLSATVEDIDVNKIDFKLESK